MKLFIWLLCLTIGGSFAFRCDETRKCDDSAIQELSALGFFPYKEELSRLCPGVLGFFDCYFTEVQKCTTLSISELAATGNEFASKLLTARNFIVDICNEDSTLHNDYVSSINCILDVTNAQSPLCKDGREKLVKDFYESRNPLQNAGKDEETILDEKICLEIVYTFACLAQDIYKNCGKTARTLYLTVLEHSNVAAPFECSIENELDLKREFVDYLKLEDDVKKAYWSVFQAVGRR
ncbi:hypothetical protein HNY73_016148 [Argiope bruennichi]|uniref:Uncharacterized protein n=1 Tax=Argiope bruennichi TaxID=94029 RepID=A0A8T0EMP9_ARGBR|nr:hypothetical protein HNY73_016148 [Argiope bruennichi]